MAKVSELEKVEAEYTELSGRAEVKAQELAKLKARLEELPGLLVEATGKDHAALAGEFGQVKAQVEVGAAELRYLQSRQQTARLAIYQAREEAAQRDLVAYMEGEYKAAVEARDETAKAVRVVDHRSSTGPEMVELRMKKEQAAAHLSLIAGPKLNELRQLRDRAQAERQTVEEEIRGVG